jgi:hypothetical protein
MISDSCLHKEAGTTMTKTEIVCVSVLEGPQLLSDQRTRPVVRRRDGSRRIIWIFISPLSAPSQVVLGKSMSFVNHSCSSLKCNSSASIPGKLLSNDVKLVELLIKSCEK